ncbi:hypothetical protein DVH24_038416 [Malus domestica]|uniref:Uncharacterized protein n=1 Tax=Malus domestica TaxID=3750 RepID=A0A498KF21_MALDO|nr:hypothetical protein DVH24_038416 [Malus domestica]
MKQKRIGTNINWDGRGGKRSTATLTPAGINSNNSMKASTLGHPNQLLHLFQRQISPQSIRGQTHHPGSTKIMETAGTLAFGYVFGFGGWERQIREKKRWILCYILWLLGEKNLICVSSSPFVLCMSESYWVYMGYWWHFLAVFELDVDLRRTSINPCTIPHHRDVVFA